MTTVEELARSDFDKAQADYRAASTQENLLAYMAATNAYEAAVRATLPPRACFFCGKVLDARAGFIETVTQPDGTRRDFCSRDHLREQLQELRW